MSLLPANRLLTNRLVMNHLLTNGLQPDRLLTSRLLTPPLPADRLPVNRRPPLLTVTRQTPDCPPKDSLPKALAYVLHRLPVGPWAARPTIFWKILRKSLSAIEGIP